MKAIDHDWGVDASPEDDEHVSKVSMLMDSGEAYTISTMGGQLEEEFGLDLSGCHIASLIRRVSLQNTNMKVFSFDSFDCIYVLEAGNDYI